MRKLSPAHERRVDFYPRSLDERRSIELASRRWARMSRAERDRLGLPQPSGALRRDKSLSSFCRAAVLAMVSRLGKDEET